MVCYAPRFGVEQNSDIITVLLFEEASVFLKKRTAANLRDDSQTSSEKPYVNDFRMEKTKDLLNSSLSSRA